MLIGVTASASLQQEFLQFLNGILIFAQFQPPGVKYAEGNPLFADLSRRAGDGPSIACLGQIAAKDCIDKGALAHAGFANDEYIRPWSSFWPRIGETGWEMVNK